jgi:glucokinase
MYIAVDIGGSTIRVAASHELFPKTLPHAVRFAITGVYQEDIQALIAAIAQFTHQPRAISIALPGVLQYDQQGVLHLPNLPEWNNQPIAQDLKQTLGDCPVVFQNDAVAAARGQAGQPESEGHSFLFLIWGTGFGGCEIHMIDNGTRGTFAAFPFEPGHHIIQPQEDAIICGCGQRGCLETFVSGKWVPLRYGHALEDANDADWNSMLNALCIGLVNILAIRPAEQIIFGGGIPLHYPEKIGEIAPILSSMLRIQPVPAIGVTSLGDDAGLYGGFSFLHTSGIQ